MMEALERALLVSVTLLGGCALIDAQFGDGDDDEQAEANCLDGQDDDGDGRADCEDPGCMVLAQCLPDPRDFTGESCNTADDTVSGPESLRGLVNEFGCRCEADTGCNDMVTGDPDVTYFCQLGFPNGPGPRQKSCGPSCNEPGRDWCAEIGFTCRSDGTCG